MLGLGPYLAQSAASQGFLEPYQPPRVAESATRHPEWRWTTLDSLPWSVSPPVQRFDDLASAPRLALPDPARSEVGMMAVLASLDRARQAQADPERGWAWWQQRIRSGVTLAEDVGGSAAAVREGRASHGLSLGLADGAAPLPGLAPVPNAIGLLAGARNPEPARALLDWLLGPEAADTIARAGGLSAWQGSANGLAQLAQAAPPLDLEWTFDQYRAVRNRWLSSGYSPARMSSSSAS
jgi:ABC-type Fe3+ transport system substrate-binding protein